MAGLIGGGLDDRFDFQFLSPSLLDEGGFDLIDGTHRALGNDGDHYNVAITDGNNNYFPGDVQRGNTLADMLIIASDHLPLIADYQVPAVLGWNWDPVANRVLVGATISVDFEISNDAPVANTIGADVLNVDIVASGDLSGSESVSVPALSPSETVSFPVDTLTPMSWDAMVTLTSTSLETQTSPEIIKLGGDVIEHANASFAYNEDLDWHTVDIAFEQVVVFKHLAFGFSIMDMMVRNLYWRLMMSQFQSHQFCLVVYQQLKLVQFLSSWNSRLIRMQ